MCRRGGIALERGGTSCRHVLSCWTQVPFVAYVYSFQYHDKFRSCFYWTTAFRRFPFLPLRCGLSAILRSRHRACLTLVSRDVTIVGTCILDSVDSISSALSLSSSVGTSCCIKISCRTRCSCRVRSRRAFLASFSDRGMKVALVLVLKSPSSILACLLL